MPNSTRIAVVEDDRDVRHSYVELLSSVGWSAIAYENGRSFLQRVGDDGPHCVVLDLRLPDMSGLDVQAELAARGIQVPLILVSGSARPLERRQALAQGAVAVLNKPVDAQLLLKSVRRAVSPQQ